MYIHSSIAQLPHLGDILAEERLRYSVAWHARFQQEIHARKLQRRCDTLSFASNFVLFISAGCARDLEVVRRVDRRTEIDVEMALLARQK